jgi:hypothetical protein
MIVVHLFFEQVYGTDLTVVTAGVLMIVAYIVLAILAAREHPR